MPEFSGTRYDIYNDYKRVVLDHDVNPVVEEPTWKRRLKTGGKVLFVGGCVGICTVGGAALGSYFFPGPGTLAGGEKGAEAGVAAATGIMAYFSGSAVATVGGGVLGLAIGGGSSFETVRLVSNVIDAHHTVKSLFHFDEFGAKGFKVVRTNVAGIIHSPLLPRLLEEPTKGDILSEDREVGRRITYTLSGNNVR